MLLASVFLAGAGTYSGGGGGLKAKPGMALPDTIYVAVDRELNIYAANLCTIAPIAASTNVATSGLAVGGSSPFVFDFDSNAGTIRNRSFRWKPTAAKDSTLTITAYDYSGKRLESASTVLRAISKTSGTGKKKTLFVGDSIFDDTGPYIVAEVDSLFSVNGGGDILPIGTQVDNGYRHESYGGKTWAYFVTNPSGPFWKSGRLNFQQYMTDNSFTGDIELVVVNLGANNAFNFATTNGRAMSAADVDTAVIQLAKAFVDTMQNATYGFPNAHIVFNLMPAPSAWSSAFGDDYGGSYNGVSVNYQKSMREITKALIREFDGGAYDRHVDVCYGGLWLDNVLGYPTTTLTSSAARIADDELVGTNWIHPDLDGKYQMADAIYSHLRYAHTLFACTNEMADSYRFTNATYWGSVATWYTATTGQADPWGGTSATLMTATASVVAGAYEISTASNIGTITANDVVLSVFLKKGNLGTGDRSYLRLYSVAAGATVEAFINWTATPTVGNSGGATAVGLIDIGGGWYQLWLHKDLSSIADTGFSVRIDPDGITPVAGDTVYIGGVQLEYGVTSPCGTYIQKP